MRVQMMTNVSLHYRQSEHFVFAFESNRRFTSSNDQSLASTYFRKYINLAHSSTCLLSIWNNEISIANLSVSYVYTEQVQRLCRFPAYFITKFVSTESPMKYDNVNTHIRNLCCWLQLGEIPQKSSIFFQQCRFQLIFNVVFVLWYVLRASLQVSEKGVWSNVNRSKACMNQATSKLKMCILKYTTPRSEIISFVDFSIAFGKK